MKSITCLSVKSYILLPQICPLSLLVIALIAGCGTPLLTDDELLERAAALCDRGRGAEALQVLDQVQEEVQALPRAQYLRGVAHELNHEYDLAKAAYDRCLEHSADDPDALNNRGSVLYRLGKLDQAEKDLTRATQFNPNDHLAWANLGLTQQYLGKLDDAIRSAQRAFALRRTAMYALQLGNLMMEKSEWDQAESYFNEALQEDSRLGAAYFSRALVQAKLSKSEQALADLELARRFDAGLELQASIRQLHNEILGNQAQQIPASQELAPEISPNSESESNRSVRL